MFTRPILNAALLALAGALAVAPAAAQDTVLVPKRVIYPNETITPELLNEVRYNPVAGQALPEIVRASADVQGKVAKRTLLPGRLIEQSALRDPYSVEAGKPVQVNFISGPLTITLTAVPLQPGAPGDMIRVRNIDSGAVFSGVVLADGTIRVSTS